MIRVDETYEGEMRLFRAKREASLRAEDGWLAASGLVILEDGKNELAFGIVTVKGDSVHIAVRAEILVTHRSAPIREAWLRPDQDDDILYVGRTSHQLIRRGDTLAIRSRDPDAELRRSFPGSDWFPVDPAWRVYARAVPLERPRTFELAYSVTAREVTATEYILVFERYGVTYALEPVVEPKRLFILFRDVTNGELTSGIGRYLYAPLPHNGRTVLDFNTALTPGCAYSEHVMYPVPPRRNMLHIRIESGEKTPRLVANE
ncbi:MAG TPA: DUF1684 domain-containing protein [Polyangiaceae bacterium]|jgi:hypothetical protein|nr:DUF1684 domain-containing protein [Polyangiaceae bacterium]